MPWILDGNNLAQGGSREKVRAAALRLAAAEKVNLVVFFDGAPPPGSPAVEYLGRVEVHYVPDADAAIVAWLARHQGDFLVATDDRALRQRVRACKGQAVGSRQFWAKVARLAQEELEERDWGLGGREREFWASVEPLPQGPQRVVRRKRGRV